MKSEEEFQLALIDQEDESGLILAILNKERTKGLSVILEWKQVKELGERMIAKALKHIEEI